MVVMKKSKFMIIFISILVAGMLLALGLGLIAINVTGSKIVTADEYSVMTGMTEKYYKAEQLNKLIHDEYYISADDQELMTGVYKGLFYGLDDPYSEYLTESEYEELMINTTGEFEGIGVTISADDRDNIIVVSTVDGSPAEQAGLKTGDIITMVDGITYSGKDLSLAAAAIRGKKGTQVIITYWRDGIVKELRITRATIIDRTVYSEILDDNIGYIRITQFENKTGKDFETELHQLELSQVKGIVIDIRNNGGGIVEAGLATADLLLDAGTITYLENNKGEKSYYNSAAGKTNVPYVLLVNGGTASTSEIVAAAVMDNEGGAIVGTRTFGKGVVQSVKELTEGDAIKLTIAQYYSPDGNVIHEKGIEPDYIVEDVENNIDEQLEKALELLK